MSTIIKYSLIIVTISNLTMWGQISKIKSINTQEGKIQIGKLWIGTDIYPYVTNLGYLGYFDMSVGRSRSRLRQIRKLAPLSAARLSL